MKEIKIYVCERCLRYSLKNEICSCQTKSKLLIVKETIDELIKLNGKIINENDMINSCIEKGLTQLEIYEYLDKLERSGEIYHPKLNHISKQ